MQTLRTTEHFLPLYDKANPYYKSRFLTWYGGRAGRKSWEIARALLLRGVDEELRIGCFREFQNSIDDSVLALLEDTISRLGLEWFYTVQKTKIIGANGTEFIFKGLARNVTSKKSLEGIDICWIEEGETISAKSWEILVPTIRKPGSQIITAFNTASANDPTYDRLITNPEPGSFVCKVTYLDNPDCPPEAIQEAERMRRLDPDAYDNIWLGNPWTRSDSQVLVDKWSLGYLNPDPEVDTVLLGGDFGFSVDPSTLIKCWVIGREIDKKGMIIKPGKLYIEKEIYKVGVEIEDYPKFYDKIPESRDYKIRGDNARPELISHIKKKGFKIVSCKKWPGSVEDGISILRSFEEIVINPGCKQTAEEARLWSYKTDRISGDVLPILIDANNHCWDAIRYAIETIIKPTKEITFRSA